MVIAHPAGMPGPLRVHRPIQLRSDALKTLPPLLKISGLPFLVTDYSFYIIRHNAQFPPICLGLIFPKTKANLNLLPHITFNPKTSILSLRRPSTIMIKAQIRVCAVSHNLASSQQLPMESLTSKFPPLSCIT